MTEERQNILVLVIRLLALVAFGLFLGGVFADPFDRDPIHFFSRLGLWAAAGLIVHMVLPRDTPFARRRRND